MLNTIRQIIALPFTIPAAILLGVAFLIRFGLSGATALLEDLGELIAAEKGKH